MSPDRCRLGGTAWATGAVCWSRVGADPFHGPAVRASSASIFGSGEPSLLGPMMSATNAAAADPCGEAARGEAGTRADPASAPFQKGENGRPGPLLGPEGCRPGIGDSGRGLLGKAAGVTLAALTATVGKSAATSMMSVDILRLGDAALTGLPKEPDFQNGEKPLGAGDAARLST